MENLEKRLTTLREKFDLFSEQHQSLRDKYRQLDAENTQLKSALQEQKNEVGELQNRIKLLKIAKNIPESDRKPLKMELNRYLREIDRCIARLNE